MSNNNLSNITQCGLKEIAIFIISLIFGTANAIYSKILMEIQVPANMDDTALTSFQKPLLLTFGMFAGMLFSLVVHGCVLLFRIPFPGYNFNHKESRTEQSALLCVGDNFTPGMYASLIIPAIFDFAANVFCLMGLQYVNASTFQMLRGSGIIFISLIKQCVLKHHLFKFHWLGVFWNVISVVLVASTAVLGSLDTSIMVVSFITDQGEGMGENMNEAPTRTMQGVWLIMAGTFMRAIQFVIEEQSLKTTVPAPLWVGMKGLWGVLLCVILVFPIGYNLPGDDNRSYQDPFHTWSTRATSPNIQVAFIIYCCTAFIYSLLGAILAFVLSSVWRAILDNFRSVTVWATSLAIFYCINPSFGEMWTRYSYLQIVGLAILIYGTAIFNAPNHCSILLEGQWWALGIDLSTEYEVIRREQKAAVDAHLAYENLAEEYDAIIAKEECAEVGKLC